VKFSRFRGSWSVAVSARELKRIGQRSRNVSLSLFIATLFIGNVDLGIDTIYRLDKREREKERERSSFPLSLAIFVVPNDKLQAFVSKLEQCSISMHRIDESNEFSDSRSDRCRHSGFANREQLSKFRFAETIR